jgi:hypothetical protein
MLKPELADGANAMNEIEWLTCADIEVMLRFLQERTSNRKLRLFACACCRYRSRSGPWQDIVTVGEHYADGLATPQQVREAQKEALRLSSSQAVWIVVAKDITHSIIPVFTHEFWSWRVRSGNVLLLLRDIFGNPFRPICINPTWLAWNDGTVVKLAEGIYDDRAFDRLPVLADALEEAGCDNAEILNHLRGPGPHVRGCWSLDLLTGRN